MQVIPISVNSEITSSDNLAKMIVNSITCGIHDGDILVISQKAVSKQEGRIVKLNSVSPSLLANGIASQYEKDPRIVQLILEESTRIVRMRDGIIIVETFCGFVCANAGVDESNVQQGYATLLPIDPDASARRLKSEISQMTSCDISVVISDTFGRPFRLGQVDCAIGVAGFKPLVSYAGNTDTFGRMLRVTEITVADEIASSAELVMGKTKLCPAAIIRDFDFAHDIHDDSEDVSYIGARTICRPRTNDLFR